MKRKNELSPISWRFGLIIFLQLISVEMGQVWLMCLLGWLTHVRFRACFREILIRLKNIVQI